MPLSMLLRNAGVAALTTCHRISYKEVLMDSRAETRAAARADADACGPSLPGATAMRLHAHTAGPSRQPVMCSMGHDVMLTRQEACNMTTTGRDARLLVLTKQTLLTVRA